MTAERRLGGRTAGALFLVLVSVTTLLGSGLLPAPHEFREDVESSGAAGIALVLAIAMIHPVIPYPAELLCLATGYAYGFAGGLALMLVLWPASCLLAYWLARRYGRGLASRTVDVAALERAERGLSGTSVPVLIALRVIPIVPFNFVSYGAGMFGVPPGRFLWTTALGIAPQLTLVTYAGSRAEELSPAEPIVWIVGGAWLLLIVAGHALRRRAAPLS